MDELVPSEFYLSQNYPNPFSEKTTIKYCVAYKTRVKLIISSPEGIELEKLVDEEKLPGTYEVEFSACHSQKIGNPMNGTFSYQIEAGDYSQQKMMIISQ